MELEVHIIICISVQSCLYHVLTKQSFDLNEVPVGGLSATSFFDLQSIQVLKGPQGTLFGRNTTGGAVLYTSHKPTDEFDFSLKGTVGNYDNREFEGMVNVPISDSLALRLSGRIQKRDGFQRNLLYNTEGQLGGL